MSYKLLTSALTSDSSLHQSICVTNYPFTKLWDWMSVWTATSGIHTTWEWFFKPNGIDHIWENLAACIHNLFNDKRGPFFNDKRGSIFQCQYEQESRAHSISPLKLAVCKKRYSQNGSARTHENRSLADPREPRPCSCHHTRHRAGRLVTHQNDRYVGNNNGNRPTQHANNSSSTQNNKHDNNSYN